MARGRSPNRDKAKQMYLDSKGEIKLVDIAATLNIKDSQVRKWKSQDKWDDELKGALPINKSNVTNKKNSETKIKKDIKEPVVEEVKEVLENTELTDKQRLFCIYYIKHFNATKAYKKAYECDYETAMTNASRLLRNAKVKEEIKRITNKCLEEQELEAKLIYKKIFQKYLDIAFSDITDYLSFGRKEITISDDDEQPRTIEVNYVDFNESSEVDGTIISEVKQGKDGVSIKLQDKIKAMQWLSDRVGELTIATREKLELEKTKLELAKIKAGENDSDEEFEDDGFMDAIKESVNEVVWTDEEIN
ncbi:terminase small subunit [Clostridium perfringens]|uniref:terminase small subunit n=1 Tax=Clostridium perfringens TaxID=1502 RepID=UPI002ED2828D|nr:terminase small subunit [Clostridium perfringens]WVM77483.1 terminase small subunit [Clostridium perfringens]